jgi:hypothetical protein
MRVVQEMNFRTCMSHAAAPPAPVRRRRPTCARPALPPLPSPPLPGTAPATRPTQRHRSMVFRLVLTNAGNRGGLLQICGTNHGMLQEHAGTKLHKSMHEQ